MPKEQEEVVPTKLVKPQNFCENCSLFHEKGKPHLAVKHCLAEAKAALTAAGKELVKAEGQIAAEQRVLWALAKSRGGSLILQPDLLRAIPKGAKIRTWADKKGAVHIEAERVEVH